MIWGRLTCINLAGCDPRRLEDHVALVEWGDRLVSLLGVRPFAGPLIHHGAEGSPDHEGLTYLLAIETSHIAAHLVPARGWAWIVIDSCQPYDEQLADVLEHCRRTFSATTWRMDQIEQRTPDDIEKSGILKGRR